MKKANAKKPDDTIEEIIPAKIKKEREFDLEGHEIFPADKVEEAEVIDGAEDTDELEEEAELDEEELNPFKDKWEE